MTHGSVPAEVRAELGIGDALVRLSVGIEDADDLYRRPRAGARGPMRRCDKAGIRLWPNFR